MKSFLGIHKKSKRPTKRYVPHMKSKLKRGESLKEEAKAIKGLSHRVIIVKSPDHYFDEAIFVIREDVLERAGADEGFVINEARRIANSYLLNAGVGKKQIRERLPGPILIAVGAAITGIIWLVFSMYGL